MPKAYQDKEDTSIYGGKASKDSLRIQAIGDVDELHSFVGLAASRSENQEIREILKQVQNELFVLGADLATPADVKEKRQRTSEAEVKRLEETIAKMEKELPHLTHFILPGGTAEASLLHVCRSVARRAERSVIKLKKQEEVNEQTFRYLNRLSDFFFTLARLANKLSGQEDETW